MWQIAAFIAVGILMIVIEVPSLIKRKKRKELWAFSFLLLAGITLSLAVSAGIQVPSPLEWIQKIYSPIMKAGSGM